MENEQNYDGYNYRSFAGSSSCYSSPPSPLASSSSSPAAIGSSNIGFQLLKKHGWKEGTGLGASQQGRLEPVEAFSNKNKRGLGADKVKNESTNLSENVISMEKQKKEVRPSSKRQKMLSKRIKKMQEVERQLQEKEFERQFFREFWPDNV